MRTCSRCQQARDEEEFSSKGRGRLQHFCRACVHEYNKEYYAQNKERYVEKAKRRNAEQKQQLRRLIYEMKDRPCSDCGVKYPPWVMDFDHREDTVKHANIADMMTHGYAAERLLQEIAKCDVVCANCHRQRTHERRMREQQDVLDVE